MKNSELKNQSHNKSLLLSLHHFTNQQLATRHIPFPELHAYRMKIEEDQSGPHHQPYQAGRKKALAYRIIFLSWSILFFTLAYFIYKLSMNWTCAVLFENCLVPKLVLCSFCLILSLASFVITIKIRTETEAASKLVARAKRRLRLYYGRKRAKMGLHRFISIGTHYKKYHAFRQALLEAIEKVNDVEEVTFLLLSHIAKNPQSYESRTKLFNQALLELDLKLQNVIYNFNTKLDNFLVME